MWLPNLLIVLGATLLLARAELYPATLQQALFATGQVTPAVAPRT
jgi:hypothetical protein